MKNIVTKIVDVIFYALIILIVCIVEGFVVGILWNWLMPDIFGLPTITTAQGLGLSILCNCLFKSHDSDKK